MFFSAKYDEALIFADRSPVEDNRIFSLLNLASEEGDDRATYALASCYRYGSFGVKKDEKIAHSLTKKLQDSNIAEAIFNIAFDYDVGNYVKEDEYKAFSFYMKAALLGNLESCVQVSRFYKEGRAVRRDARLAKCWRDRSKFPEEKISSPSRVWLR